jgi:hypothetical protein
LTRAAITLHNSLAKEMDCRGKPGNDKQTEKEQL